MDFGNFGWLCQKSSLLLFFSLIGNEKTYHLNPTWPYFDHFDLTLIILTGMIICVPNDKIHWSTTPIDSYFWFLLPLKLDCMSYTYDLKRCLSLWPWLCNLSYTRSDSPSLVCTKWMFFLIFFPFFIYFF